MSQALGITVDNVVYKVGIDYRSMKRSFKIEEGAGKGSAVSGKTHLDQVGLYYEYKLKFRSIPDNQADYDALYLKLSEPVYSHTITLPFAQRQYTFDVMISSGSDKFKGDYGDTQIWDELEITFVPVNPVDSETLNNLRTALG